MFRKLAVAVVCCAFCVQAAFSGDVSSNAKKISSAGMKYLASNQNDDGSYGKSSDVVNTTAIVVYAFASGDRKYRYNNGPFVSMAVDYLVAKQKDDGSFGSYEATVNTVQALNALKEKKFAPAIAKAEGFLKSYNVTGDHWRFYDLILAGSKSAVLADAQKAVSEKSLALAEKSVGEIMQKQELEEKSPKLFGKIDGLGQGALADPMVAAALCSIAADQIKMAAKKMK